LDEFFIKVLQVHKALYPVIHRKVWDRRRKSPIHRDSTPAVYVPPVP
jgi:hypothetical protein